MNVWGSFFVLLLLSGSISIAYAHPIPTILTVQDQDGVVLYERELDAAEKEESESLELFSEEWIYHNFIWIFASVIITTVSISTVLIYREETTSTISKIIKLH